MLSASCLFSFKISLGPSCLSLSEWSFRPKDDTNQQRGPEKSLRVPSKMPLFVEKQSAEQQKTETSSPPPPTWNSLETVTNSARATTEPAHQQHTQHLGLLSSALMWRYWAFLWLVIAFSVAAGDDAAAATPEGEPGVYSRRSDSIFGHTLLRSVGSSFLRMLLSTSFTPSCLSCQSPAYIEAFFYAGT